jgi:hypothetical protein
LEIGPTVSTFRKLAETIRDLPKGAYSCYELAKRSSLDYKTVSKILFDQINWKEFCKYSNEILPPERRFLKLGDKRAILGLFIDPGLSIASQFAERPFVREYVRGRELIQTGVEAIFPVVRAMRERLDARRPSERWGVLAEKGLMGFLNSPV